jgi:hypothetical protein
MQDVKSDSAGCLALVACCARSSLSACRAVRPVPPVHTAGGLIRAAPGFFRRAKTEGRVGGVERANRNMTDELNIGSIDLKIRAIQFVKSIGFIER